MRRGIPGLCGALLTVIPSVASAQLWNALDTVPKPNAIIAHDTSVTMGINTGCTGCHNRNNSRLEASKQDILQTLPLFRDYFNFGAFQYAGCEFAKITARVLPTPDNPDISYVAVTDLIQSAESCDSKEERLPGGTVTTCATAGCAGDQGIALDLINLSLPGFDPLAPFLHVNCAYSYVADFAPCVTDTGLPTDATGYRGGCYHIGCTDIGGIDGFLFAIQQLPTIDWPRWTQSGVTPQQVIDEFCDPVREALTNVYNQILACRPENEGYSTFPQQINASDWCNPGLIAQNACAAGSTLYNTCVCDNSNPACISGGSPVDACGNPFTWKARQQVAVCESYEPGGAFDNFFAGQPDNVVNGECRENAALFFTDGYMGDTPGTDIEAFLAVPTYESVSGFSNMAVFRIADNFAGSANAMMSSMTDGIIPTAYSALDAATMQESFSRLLNRIYKGVYTGASTTLDSQGTRIYFHSFTVPGYNDVGPSDNYLGWPARISAFTVADDGTFGNAPVWETDWADRAGGAPGCGPSIIGGGNVDQLGPGGTFRNGVARTVNIGADTLDRDGDDLPDDHPPLLWGEMYSIAATRPIVVEAPRDAGGGKYSGEYRTFVNSNAVRERARAVYTMGNGYVYGFFGGAYDATPGTFGLRKLAFTYDDGGNSAGTQILRYQPSWVANPQGPTGYRYDVNNLIQQPLTTGQLAARELRIPYGGGYAFRTVLVGAQGKEGRGFFSLDITDPCSVTPLAEWRLPQAADRASVEPYLYTFPTGTPDDRPVVVTTGGLGGTSNLYAFDVASGALVAQVGLPGGPSYLAAPICLDATGDQRITHCYVLREDGMLARVDVAANGGFGAVNDVTAPGVIGGGRRFTTTPAVFFDPSGNVNLVFGSGDFERLTQTGPANNVYKVVDRNVRKRNIGNAPTDVDQACGGLDPSGIIPLGAQERVISPPTVAKGVVAWTTYTPTTNACLEGQANLYAMNYLTCTDATDGNGPPSPVPLNDGLPASPVLHRDSQQFIAGTSAGPTADQTVEVGVDTRGAGRPWAKRLYWRAIIDAR
jgi:hypothetical protein